MRPQASMCRGVATDMWAQPLEGLLSAVLWHPRFAPKRGCLGMCCRFPGLVLVPPVSLPLFPEAAGRGLGGGTPPLWIWIALCAR